MKTKEKARSILTKTVNTLTSKMEIGGPMASLYLFGNPDHYASNFFTVYWKTTFEKFSSPGNQKKICKKLFLKNQLFNKE